MQSTSCEMSGWMKHKLDSISQEKYNNLINTINTNTINTITSDTQMTPPLLKAESEDELKSLLMKVKEESKN